MMKIDVLSLFPEMFTGVLGSSILKKAAEKEAVSYQIINFRDFSDNKHQSVDDYPYGGGAGMVLKPQPIFDAVDHLKEQSQTKPRVILLCPQGEQYTQQDRKSTRLNSSHVKISYADYCYRVHRILHSFPTRRSSDLL